MRWGILAGLLFVCAGTAPAQVAHHPAHFAALSPQASQAAETVDAFHAALRRGDTDGAAMLLAAGAVIFEGGDVERSKAEYAAHHLGADAQFAAAVPSKVSRRSGSVIGNMAWVATEGRTTGSFKGRDVDSVTTETAILERVGSNWKIVHLHWSSRKAGAAD
ncbi:nuclear transport factor 2 family protein [Sphingomonas sinipercae]|uniref:Nuclear transport factor 2 family protein n=1 Tax=Sphingomonas sinipercae TaxID=2714944 RepID=A0A6G7ZM12_9SPHN|nr:nuclear transport factor 2 family protein [Sphingomonas sinipercae]QIL01962.1 nuclear transport factor 2 family protein [Sphingomonas sinipercae]